MKILVVENTDDHRMLLEFAFQTAGCEVIPAMNCAQALDALKGNMFDAAVFDLGLPGIDGITCAETFHKTAPRTRLYANTAYVEGDVHTNQQLEKAGFERCFRKGTYEATQLVEIVLEDLKHDL